MDRDIFSSSARTSLPFSSSGGIGALDAIFAFPNVSYETARVESGGELKLRWVALAIEADELELALESLAQTPSAIDPLIHEQASITRLYPDGGVERIPIVQIEFAARLEEIPRILQALNNAGLLSRRPDKMIIIRDLSDGRTLDGQVFPAGSAAPYSHFIRWRRPAPARTCV